MNPVLESGVTYLESLLLQALDWNTSIQCPPAKSPSTHKQPRYHGDLTLNSLRTNNSNKNNSRAALLVSKILLHILACIAANENGKNI